jgi:hypothetical protein
VSSNEIKGVGGGMGANRERGEVDLFLDGEPKTLRMSMNALCLVEARTGITFAELINRVAAGSLVYLREFVWGLLQDHHSTEFPTVESVGDVIDRVGMVVCAETVKELLELNQPQAAAGNPPTAGTGAGRSSTAAA